jgi:hypothetical protein
VIALLVINEIWSTLKQKSEGELKTRELMQSTCSIDVSILFNLPHTSVCTGREEKRE